MKPCEQWNDRLEHWINTLTKDFYIELGSIEWEGFPTYEQLSPGKASLLDFRPYPEGEEWGAEWQYLWLRGEITLPGAAAGKMIVLDLSPGGETTLFVDGEPFGTYRARDIPIRHHFLVDNYITESGVPGTRYRLLCEAYAGHFFADGPRGGLGVGPVLPGTYTDPYAGRPRARLGHSGFGIWNEEAYQLWLDAVTLRKVMDSMSDGSLRAQTISRALQGFTLCVDFEQPMENRVADYQKARGLLRPVLDAVNGTTAPRFYAVGNAHLDVAWLWPLAETARKTARTFAAQLRLLEKYPSYRFLQSQPQTYAMCKEQYPELYAKIKESVRDGRWIVEGGMWVEPDTNMASGESLIRQLLHGMKFFRDEFDIDCEILWLPDTFGYSAALPQILVGCGIKYLVTQKIFWSYNGGERFPYHYFSWQGMDGTKIKSFLPTSYTYDTDPGTLISTWENRVQKDDIGVFLLPFGYGDGGGGPCRDHIEYTLRAGDLEGCPRVEVAHPAALFRELERNGEPEHTYVGELYFTAHRGVYTSQAKTKRGNRKCELALREAEMWGSLAAWYGYDYPAAEMDAAWKKVLLNQFHDILPGSSIARVYHEALQLYGEVSDTCLGVIRGSAGALSARGVDAPAERTGIEEQAEAGYTEAERVVYNSLSWERSCVITQDDGSRVLVRVPSCGSAPVRPVIIQPGSEARAYMTGDGAVLENGIIRAEIDGNGEVVSFILKETGREFAAGAMNRFLLYKDTPRLFDAWDVDSIYELEPVETDRAAELSPLYSDGVKAAVSIRKKIGNSALYQEISICAESRRLEFDTIIDWNELHRLLKASFPVSVATDEALHEIQYGYIKRPNHRSRAYDKDRFEVCNHRYTALCDEGHGAAVLNDCKYGVNVLGNAINLTLLRAAAAPEMKADNGEQRFTYAFTAWEGAWLGSPAVREGYELNVTPIIIAGRGEAKSYLSIDGGGSVVIDSVKPSEDGSADVIVRLYESKHTDCRAALKWTLPVARAELCDMLENPYETLEIKEQGVDLHFRPFEVKTLRLRQIPLI